MAHDLEMQRDEIEISGGRRLYRYRFTEDGVELPPMRPEDVVSPPKPVEEEKK